MKQHILVALAIGVCSTVLAADLPQAKSDRWGKFGVGSWASYRVVKSGVAKEETFRLASVTSTDVTVEISTGKGTKLSKKKVTFPFAREDKPDRVEKESIDFKGRRLKCRVEVYQKQGVKVWLCDAVPGFLVKSQGSKSVTTLIDFRAVSR